MTADKVKLLNIEIDNYTKEEFLVNLKKGLVVTPNIDHMVKLQKDKEFYDLYQKADHVVLDSRVIKLMLKLTRSKIKDVIPGSEFFPLFYEHHKNNSDMKVFLLGAKEGVAQTAMDNINNKTNSNIIVGAHSPSFGFEKDESECQRIIEIINNSGANVLAIGVGAPKQEKWGAKFKDQLKNIDIILCIGATIDFEAGHIKRAPKIYRALALEWLYRIFKDPKRLFKRYFVEDLPFFALFTKHILGTYKNPFNK